MNLEIVLKIGGIYNILCAVLHVFFPKMLKWDEIVPLIPGDRRPFVEQPLHIMNWCMAISWAMLAYIPIFHAQQLLEPGLGRTLLASIVIFWIFRIFILQPIYIGFKDPVSLRMTGFFLVGLALFAVPFILSF